GWSKRFSKRRSGENCDEHTSTCIEAFKWMRGTVSFPFVPGEHKSIAVKVIDFRGNEVMRIIKLNTGGIDYGS
ncbi:MAG: hypothetical protein V2G48_03190, partial [bacterium JZ-2024 1]